MLTDGQPDVRPENIMPSPSIVGGEGTKSVVIDPDNRRLAGGEFQNGNGVEALTQGMKCSAHCQCYEST